MKLSSRPVLLFAATLALGVAPFRAHADDYDKKTVITVDEPIQVVNTYLQPGTYVFKLINSASDRHIVEIYNEDQSHLIDMIIAVPNYRLQPTSSGRSQFTFWETPPGTPRAVRAWFYPGESYGHEFGYPTDLKQVSVATAAVAAPQPAPAPIPQTLSSVTEPERSEALTPAPSAPEQPRQEEPVQIAQNAQPPAAEPQAQLPAPEPDNQQSNQELPKTASPYPLIGLGGLLSAGLAVLLRVKRLS